MKYIGNAKCLNFEMSFLRSTFKVLFLMEIFMLIVEKNDFPKFELLTNNITKKNVHLLSQDFASIYKYCQIRSVTLARGSLI